MTRLLGAPTNPGIRKGDLVLRLAQGEAEVRACQRLRYMVFYEELSAHPDADARAARIDADRFDDICDHLVVVRQGSPAKADAVKLSDGELVGTYRLLRQDVATRHGGFYTAGEYDIAPMLARHADLQFLELGRSCVLAPYRTMPVIELLWQGIWDYVRANGIDVMFGCASFDGVDPARHARALGFLARYAPSRPDWRVRALSDRHVAMANAAAEDIDRRSALAELPPLVKGYLRCGATFGDGAVIDSQFGTTDVFVVMPVADIDRRVFGRFGAGKASEPVAA